MSGKKFDPILYPHVFPIGHVECNFHHSAKSLWQKPNILPLSLRIYIKNEIVPKNFSVQTVLMNMWIEVLTNRRRFFFQIRKVFFQRPFLFSSKLSYWHIECILITRLNFVRQKPRIIRSWSEKKDRKTTCRMPSCQLRRKFVEVRPRQSSSRSQTDEGKNPFLTEKPLFSRTFLCTRRMHFWQFRPRMSDKKLKFFRSIKNKKIIYF